MKLLRKPFPLILAGTTALLLGITLIICILPSKKSEIYQHPEAAPVYYYIYAEEDGRELMRVPLLISIDDELITEDNKRYRIVHIEGNKGIARYVEDLNMENLKPK